MHRSLVCLLVVLSGSSLFAAPVDVDDSSPFWPTPQSPKLITQQWIGEPGVEAAVVLAIDDMRDPAKYEAFLRPIVDRLKQIDGRAHVSIMTNTVAPEDPRLASFLAEGISIESHTLTHPCPLLGKADFAEASRTFHESVDLLAEIPGNHAVAFRMPCCDSMNSASPRFFSEIFSRPSAPGRWLAIDSSVFTRPPGERYLKYFPDVLRPPMKKTLGDYAGFIDDYPFPFVIGKLCWEFPCMVPSDWEAFNAIGAKSPAMLEDWKAGLDRVVEQKGVFTAVFHPHGWSAPEQWVAFIDYAQEKYGRRVKFLNFPEALARLEKNLLEGHSLRDKTGGDNGVRLLDVDGDGFMDVVMGSPMMVNTITSVRDLQRMTARQSGEVTRVWLPSDARWQRAETPFFPEEVTFGIVHPSALSALQPDHAWTWKSSGWVEENALCAGLQEAPKRGWGLRDFDHDGQCELLADHVVFAWNKAANRWEHAYDLPPGLAVLDAEGRDNGLRFADLDGDGFDDVLQSNDAGYAIYQWAGTVKANLGWSRGWPHLIAQGPAGTTLASAKLLPFVHEGRDAGAWFHHDSIVWQNETVATREAESVSRTFKELIAFPVPPELTPEASLAALQAPPGFTVELVAAEPLIESPVDFDWDAQGRLWVVEMPDYPLGMDGHGKPGGMVKILTDRDGDGRYDEAVTFLQDLPFPTGIIPWRDGVIVACSPDIIFAADTNGDGRADERRVLFTGFREGNQQHRMNGFAWGLDGWIYGGNGDSGGTVKGVNISGRDFRFRPDTGEFETESGSTQFGRRRDDWGHWFGNNNSNWLYHFPLAEHYLRRNPKLAVPATRRSVVQYPDATRVYPISELAVRFNQPQSLGHLTSGCAANPYRDDLFGPAYANSVFISEPVHNLVHREVLTPDGASFTSQRAPEEAAREFLASKDPWFRPTTTKTGPDGALYVADFHRFVLEHPEWISPETQRRLDLRAGAERGRLYRVFPTGAKLPPLRLIDLTKLTPTGLATLAMESPNGWQRDTAQRLLVESGGQEAVPALRRQAVESAQPKVRLQALATLGILHGADAATVRRALHDPHPAVREEALRVSETAGAPEVLEELIATGLADPEFVVRRQLALTLGAFHDPRAESALEQLAAREGTQPEMRLAILSSLTPESPLFAKLNGPAAPLPAPLVLPKPTTPDRARVIASYRGVASLQGEAARGHTLFQQQCLICHRLKGEGKEVGPDLAMVFDKPVDWLLTALFDPSAAVEDRYRAQTLELKSGAAVTGIISSESANNVVVRLPGGTDFPVLRTDLARQQNLGKSLMPEGLESVLKPQDVADIIAWLRAR